MLRRQCHAAMPLPCRLAGRARRCAGADPVALHRACRGRCRGSVLRGASATPLEPDRCASAISTMRAFLIETPGGLVGGDRLHRAISAVADVVPDVVTMNNAHRTHWTANPDPRIPHVLRGWGEGGGPADHRLDLGEMLVRNVTTDTRGRFGEGARRGRQFDLHLRGGGPVHRPSGPPAPDPARRAICGDRAAGCGDGAGRWRLYDEHCRPWPRW